MWRIDHTKLVAAQFHESHDGHSGFVSIIHKSSNSRLVRGEETEENSIVERVIHLHQGAEKSNEQMDLPP